MFLFLCLLFQLIVHFIFLKEIELIRSSYPNLRGLLRTINTTSFLLSNLNDTNLYYDILTGQTTSTNLYSKYQNKGETSLLFFINNEPRYLISPGSSGSGLDFQDLSDNSITSYQNTSLLPPFNFTQI